MKRRRYSDETIIFILKEHIAVASVHDLARGYGIVDNTIYRWKSKFGGLGVFEAKRLRDQKQEKCQAKMPAAGGRVVEGQVLFFANNEIRTFNIHLCCVNVRPDF